MHKTIDGGVHWTRFSPDVTANGAEGQVISGEPITRDMTGEEVYAALYSMRASSSGCERLLDWFERRPGVGDQGQRQNVEERDAEGAAAGRPGSHDRGFTASSRLGLRLGVSDVPERFQTVLYMTNDLRRALEAAYRWNQRHPGRSTDAHRS